MKRRSETTHDRLRTRELDACPVCRASFLIIVYFEVKINGRNKDMALIIEVVYFKYLK